jgi:hypothetical protein
MFNEIGKLRISHATDRIFIVFKLFYKSFVRMYELNLGENPGPGPKEMYTAVMSNVNISLVSPRIVF